MSPKAHHNCLRYIDLSQSPHIKIERAEKPLVASFERRLDIKSVPLVQVSILR